MLHVVQMKSYALKKVDIKYLDYITENIFTHRYEIEKNILLNHTDTIL